MTTTPDDQENTLVEQEADDIASKVSGILIKAFKDREGRDPTNDEISELFEELTEDRIEELLGLKHAESVDGEAKEERNNSAVKADSQINDNADGKYTSIISVSKQIEYQNDDIDSKKRKVESDENTYSSNKVLCKLQ